MEDQLLLRLRSSLVAGFLITGLTLRHLAVGEYRADFKLAHIMHFLRLSGRAIAQRCVGRCKEIAVEPVWI